jgi:hypothetical protein
LHVQRWIARKAENVSWQPISREVASLLTQMGAVAGLRDIGDGPRIEGIPSLTSAVVGNRQHDGHLANTTDIAPGVTVNWSATPNTALTFAANPDSRRLKRMCRRSR